ncbi:DNA mismatch repair protein MSH1, mitochondrial isoform X2 [Brachypodium distachyon]|uniref:DNA mismatch repair protein MSH1, mitochondrial isoform X2 n=1 Tax=Brachypodium distachyon TaxID=15368 RepID=UPI000530082E|nr:DNA mismatch repair protein MSH1, mitochondrial isoform X2 [Brachypodium distachyon]|eukprot:XP_024311971.1 DNA mismatch repair protein MSH1, mitochondrial isoform X2 [Brachypodium distachyon]
MQRLLASTIVAATPRWLPLADSIVRRRRPRRSPLPVLSLYKPRKVSRGITMVSNKVNKQGDLCNEGMLSHIMWWKEKMESCRKPSSVQLTQRLVYSNILGLDPTLRNGSLKDGTLNMEMLQFKSKFPREVLLCRVGDFYEAIGFDACILVEHAGLNPFGGLRSDSIPKAGCPIMNLRQTLDDLTRSGYSVCIVEEIQGPTQARARKGRFISGHAHPGSPYVFGLAEVDHDLEFPDPMPVVGISRSAKGYCLISVLETMKTYSAEEGLTEEAVVTKLRICRYHHLYLHSSLRNNSSGTSRWGEFGEGGLLWGECSGKCFEWFDGSPIEELLCKVREIYGLDEKTNFRNVTVSLEGRPQPLYLGTATQIGVIQTEGIPSLLKMLLPPNYGGLPSMYIRDLLLNPPSFDVASAIQEACRLMGSITCSIPEFTCIPSAKLVKLLESKEVNHIEFCRIKNVLDDIILMNGNTELSAIMDKLLEPASVVTGLKVDADILIRECSLISQRIGEVISLGGESDQAITSSEYIPKEFFNDMESSWKGRVKRVHAEEEFTNVDVAAEALSTAVTEDFLPIIVRVKSVISSHGGSKGEISYAKEHEAVWFKGKRFTPNVWANTPGEQQIKQLKPAIDSKGRKVGEEWFTTIKVENALARYHEACDSAKGKVLELLRGLSSELQDKINILVFCSTLLIIAKALFGHVSEGLRRGWVLPAISPLSKDYSTEEGSSEMDLLRLFPYWLDSNQGNAILNDVNMHSLFILTGPNGGGKSSMLRSVCAAALLGICGLMVPAASAVIPHFDSIMLHMKAYDSPADGKSSFQIEMSEIRSLVSRATGRSLVLIDEICRGTETAKGTCIAGSIIERLDDVGCLGIISTHLHGIFDLPLSLGNTDFKAMGTEVVNGCIQPTWRLMDGICRESLAFQTARKEGMPDLIIKRAEELYSTMGRSKTSSTVHHGPSVAKSKASGLVDMPDGLGNGLELPSGAFALLRKDVEIIVTAICKDKLLDLYNKRSISELVEVVCVTVGAREQPPPSTVGRSSIYIVIRRDNKLYVGQTDDLVGRLAVHRSKEGMQGATILYIVVPGKSVACQLETLLINQLPSKGFKLTNKADGKHRNFGMSVISGEAIAAH